MAARVFRFPARVVVRLFPGLSPGSWHELLLGAYRVLLQGVCNRAPLDANALFLPL